MTALPGTDASDQAEPLIDRLCTLIEEETAALAAGRTIDLEQFNRRKNHAILELRQLTAGPAGERPPEGSAIHRGLTRLRDLLQENERTLQRHLTAARHISAMLGQAITEHESDGTYSPATLIDRRA